LKRIVADNERCVGGGACVMNAPEVFDQDESGRVVVLDETPRAELWAAALEAVTVCPGAALRLVED
jgi:ferredoxin